MDAEKCGLPRVLDTIEVSCKTRHNIKLLCNLVYDTVFSLRNPGKSLYLILYRFKGEVLFKSIGSLQNGFLVNKIYIKIHFISVTVEVALFT